MDEKRLKIFTNGCFDILHVGHFNLLYYCRQIAGPRGKIVVALDSDEKITKDKGYGRPVYTYQERADALYFLDIFIDEVVPFSSNEELHEIVKKQSPDFIVKGGEWEGNVVGSDLAPVKLFPVYDKEDYSTTSIIKRVFANHSCGVGLIDQYMSQIEEEEK